MRVRRRQNSGLAPGAPPHCTPLTVSVARRVRFEEVDPLGIMWHGRYASWLEDGREALGKAYGIHYLDFYGHGVAIPVKIFHLDYSQTLLYGEEYIVHTSLIWSEAALLDIEYRITDQHNAVTTRGYTTQLMVSLDHKLLLEQPEFYRAFRTRWEAGAFAAAGSHSAHSTDTTQATAPTPQAAAAAPALPDPAEAPCL